MNIPIGQASNIDYVFIQDSSSTTGAGLTGITSGSAGLAGRYIYPGGTSVALTFETISTLGTYQAPTSNAHLRIKELDATNHPGVYEIHYHNDWFSTANARKAAILTIKGVTNMAQLNHKVTIDYALQPTTAARTLDVASTGEAGLDYNNVNGTVGDSAGVTTLLSRLSSARAGYLDNLSAGAVALASSLSTLQTDVTTLLGRITSTLFSGITSLKEWLGLIAGKQTGNTTARTELRATGAGSGTFDETTDSQEAIRDNMGTAQTGDAYARLGAPAGASIAADIAAIPAAVWAVVVHTGITALQAMRMFGAMLAGKTSGATTGTVTFRNPIDTLDAMVITMTGSNRTATTKDLSA